MASDRWWHVALIAAFAFLPATVIALQPPPLASLAGIPVYPDSNPRDMPTITNFFGSVGSSHNDVLGLSEVLLPPYLDVGLPTAAVTVGEDENPCSPELSGPWKVNPDSNFNQTFILVSSNASLRTYNLTCVGPDCTSWHTASATMPAPFTSYHIIYNEIPPHHAFEDDGTFDSSCTVVRYAGGSGWCATTLNPTCTATSSAVPVEGWQWAPTSITRWGGPTTSETRMIFEGNGVLQRLTVTAPLSSALSGLAVALTGAVRAYKTLTWITTPPESVDGFNYTLTTVGPGGHPALLTCDSNSPACAVWVVVGASSGNSSSIPLNVTLKSHPAATMRVGFPSLDPGTTTVLSIALVMAADSSAALDLAAVIASDFTSAWDYFEIGWQLRWLDAFTPKPTNTSGAGSGSAGHFSGSLPVLQLEDSAVGVALSRQYYMGVLAILLLERTNLPALYPRVYITGTGNYMCGIQIGGTQQWAWDQTFYGMLQALLDPAATRADLSLWIGQPIDTFNGFALDSLTRWGGFYAFNALSLYRSYSTYLRITNDTSFLAQCTKDLDTLADFYIKYTNRYNPSGNSTLADYSGGAGVYLECVPTYVHATAGLQGGNAYMALDLADLRQTQGNQSGATALRARAAAIGAETVKTMYVSSSSGRINGSAPGDRGGWWRVVDTKPGGSGTKEVRHVVDFAYATMGFCSPRWPDTCALNASVSSQMTDFVLRQLSTPHGGQWMRALSPLDGAAPVERPDHGSTGSYDAWPAMTFDALTALGKGFETSLPFLVGVSAATVEGPFGQAHGVADDGVSVFKTTGGCNRAIANNGAGFAESMLRLVFGYEPGWSGAGSPVTVQVLPNVPRGLRGVLACIRGPNKGDGTTPLYATATLTASGVQFAWSDAVHCGHVAV